MFYKFRLLTMLEAQTDFIKADNLDEAFNKIKFDEDDQDEVPYNLEYCAAETKEELALSWDWQDAPDNMKEMFGVED